MDDSTVRSDEGIPVEYPMQAVGKFGGLAELDGETIVTITNHELLAYLTYGPDGFRLIPTSRGWMLLNRPPDTPETLQRQRPSLLRQGGALS